MVVATTTRKRKGNRVGKEPVRRSKRARRLPLDNASDGGDSCPEWCHSNDSLPARIQQARCCRRAIWAQPNHTLLGGSWYGACIRARADKCFVVQTPVGPVTRPFTTPAGNAWQNLLPLLPRTLGVLVSLLRARLPMVA